MVTEGSMAGFLSVSKGSAKRKRSSSEGSRYTALLLGEEFEFGEGAGPVGAEEAGEAAVGEEFAAGLASGAIVGFVVGVADALDGITTTRAREFVAAMDGHAFAKGRNLFGKLAGGFGTKASGPVG